MSGTEDPAVKQPQLLRFYSKIEEIQQINKEKTLFLDTFRIHITSHCYWTLGGPTTTVLGYLECF